MLQPRERAQLFLGEGGQNFGGVAFRRDGVPDVFELAIGADQECASHNSEERFAEEFLHASRAEGFDCFQIRIAEKIEVELLFGFECGLCFDGVAAHTEDDYP